MYRRSEEYDRMAKLAIDIIIDYDIKDFPLDMDDLCKRMQINLVPYSAFENNLDILLKKSRDGFNVPRSTKWLATIVFNDQYGKHLTPARISQTKGHEIKHIVEEDKDDSEDDLCEYFSKYLRCPIPYVLYLGITSKFDLISQFGISDEQAGFVLSNISNRKRKYGNIFFDYEVELLEHLVPDFSKK